jgi:hypothetical protein
MGISHCPICAGELEVRDVKPCFVCGAWEMDDRNLEYHDFEIRDGGHKLTLCHICWLEEILSNQGDLKDRLRISTSQDLRECLPLERQKKDKYCETCRTRLALLKIMIARHSETGLDRWKTCRT